MASVGGIKAGQAYVSMGLDDTELAKGLRSAENRLRAFGTSVQAIGQSIVKFGTLAATPLAVGSKLFSDFESQMARVKAITNATGPDFAAMGELAKKLGRDTVFSAAQAAEAMGNFAQSNLSVKEIMAATGPTLDLAAAAHIEIADAASIATKVMKGMGIEAGDLSSVVDLMAKAVTSSNTDITMLADAFKFVGPIARTAGIGLDEITAAIQLLSDAGIQGEMAGTTLRGMILSLSTPSEAASKMMAKLEVTAKDGAKNFLPLVSIISQLQSALGGMGSADKLEKLGTIFSDRQAGGVAALVDAGAEKLAGKTKALGNRTGTAARIAGVQLDTLRGAVEQLMSSLEGVGIAIGEALNPVLRSWGDQLVGLVNTIAAVAEKNRDLVVSAAEVAASAIGIGAALVGIGLAAKAVAAGIGLVRVALTALTATIAIVNGAFRLLAISISATSLATSIFGGLSAVLAAMASPVGIIVVGLTALVAGIVATGNSGKVLSKLGGAFKVLKDDAMFAFKGIADALKAGDIGLAGEIMWAALKVEWLRGIEALKSLTSDWGVATKEVFKGISFSIAGFFIDALASARSAVADAEDLPRIERDRLQSHDALKTQQSVEVEDRRKAAREDAAKAAIDLKKAQDDLAGLVGRAKENVRPITDAESSAATGAVAGALGGQFGGIAGLLTGATARAKPKPGAALAEKPAGVPEDKKKPEEFTPENLDKQIEKARISVTGAFNASSVAGLGAGEDVADKQLDEQKRTNENLKEIKKAVDKQKKNEFT